MTSIASIFMLVLLAQQGEKPQYVGSAQCMTCHEDTVVSFKKTRHFQLEKTEKGCESCHGPGSEHADTMDASKIRSFKKLTPLKTASACLDCHKQDTHSNRLFDSHSRNGVSCTSCHSVHAAAAGTRATSKPTNELCQTCHASQRAQFNRPFGHKLEQAAMDCVSCHAPHGSNTRAQTVASHSNQTSCLSCHSDKRGPFAFEHMPVKVGGCVSCHEPHGSSNPRMLVRSEVRQVCLECHTNSTAALGRTPPAFHDLRSDRYQNCTICHTKVHGSHTSPALLR